jgi:hypothetical protein
MRGLILAALMVFGGSATVLAEDAAPYDPYADMVISDDIKALPKPVQDKRAALIEAAKSGDIEALKAIFDAQKTPVQVSYGDPEDAIAYLKTASADGNGAQTLAILGELLDAPYAIIGATSDTPSYVWPYLAMVDVTKLTPAQLVDAYRILPAETVAELTVMESWYYWRVFIDPNGDLSAFIAGD